jgi:hypothetical protein
MLPKRHEQENEIPLQKMHLLNHNALLDVLKDLPTDDKPV